MASIQKAKRFSVKEAFRVYMKEYFIMSLPLTIAMIVLYYFTALMLIEVIF